MKRAFTLFELILVIVIIGILSALISPQLSNTTLNKAADQIIYHIRYTQHLALTDNRFDPNDATWYKTRWQIYFSKNSGSGDMWAYTIFSDFAGTHTGVPDPKEVARNPLNPSQYLTGGTSGTSIIHFDEARATKELNLGHEYDVQNIVFENCGTTTRIAFDHLGRPFTGNQASMTHPYQLNRMLQDACRIILSNSSLETITIVIEPETGYAHIES